MSREDERHRHRWENGYGGGGKIYLTRTKFWPKKEFGEKYIEKMFGKNGYKIVSPERLNLSEQIRLFSRADEIVSIEGTVAHNILFARENTNQVIIRKRNTHNKRQPIFNQITKTTVSYIDCFYNPFHLNVSHDSGPFLLLFNDNIKEFFLDRNLKYNNLYIIYNMSAILFYTLHILFHKIFDVCIKIKLLILKTIRVLKVNGR